MVAQGEQPQDVDAITVRWDGFTVPSPGK